jgi:hypothetical protein
MTDLINLIPHCKKDAKLDTKSDRKVIDEVADMKVMGQPEEAIMRTLDTPQHPLVGPPQL